MNEQELDERIQSEIIALSDTINEVVGQILNEMNIDSDNYDTYQEEYEDISDRIIKGLTSSNK